MVGGCLIDASGLVNELEADRLEALEHVGEGVLATPRSLARPDLDLEAPDEVASGRVEDEFELEVAGFGRFTVFLRLFASDGALVGASFARGEFGEFEMPIDLSPA